MWWIIAVLVLLFVIYKVIRAHYEYLRLANLLYKDEKYDE